MKKEKADQIIELFKCEECAPSFRVSEDFEKGYFIPCEKHKDIANLNYFKKWTYTKEFIMRKCEYYFQLYEGRKKCYSKNLLGKFDDDKWYCKKHLDSMRYKSNNEGIKIIKDFLNE